MPAAAPVDRPSFATLTPGSPAPSAYARALGATMRKVRAQGNRVLAEGTASSVHDFRILLRALRSLLWAARGVLGRGTHEQFRNECRWLAQRTAAVRDLDVLDSALPDYVAALTSPTADVESALRSRLANARTQALADLRDTLRSARYRALQRQWQTTLQAVRAHARSSPTATLGADLGPRLTHLCKQLGGYRRRSLTDPAVVHAFRKDCKRLRDLLVVFAGLWIPTSRDAAIAQCRRVLARCGDRWDLQVHAGLLQHLFPLHGPAARDTWADALTDMQETRSTRAMRAIRTFQDEFELPAMRRVRRRAGAG